jgi:hypothetical protein
MKNGFPVTQKKNKNISINNDSVMFSFWFKENQNLLSLQYLLF